MSTTCDTYPLGMQVCGVYKYAIFTIFSVSVFNNFSPFQSEMMSAHRPVCNKN